jgi:uncharacterized protein YheU (UPF0270 family)
MQDKIMRNYHEQMDGRMFDFEPYYQMAAERLPDNCRICEVGIAHGKSAIFLAEAVLNLDKVIERFVMIDNLAYGQHEQLTSIIKNLIGSGIGAYSEFFPFGSLEASFKFPDGYFDFVFIDSSHDAAMTRAEIVLWYAKIRDGGFLAGHDYDQLADTVDRIIPDYVIYEGTDKPIKVRTIYETNDNHGIWEVQKHRYHKLKPL